MAEFEGILGFILSVPFRARLSQETENNIPECF